MARRPEWVKVSCQRKRHVSTEAQKLLRIQVQMETLGALYLRDDVYKAYVEYGKQ